MTSAARGPSPAQAPAPQPALRTVISSDDLRGLWAGCDAAHGDTLEAPAHGGGEGGDGSEGRVRRGKVHPAAGDDGDGIAMGVLGALARGEAAPLVGE